jgi:hypothetical protein
VHHFFSAALGFELSLMLAGQALYIASFFIRDLVIKEFGYLQGVLKPMT